MKVSEINPFIRYAYLQTLRPMPFVTYAYDHRLAYAQSGSFLFHYSGGETKQVGENSLLIWRPGIPYRFETQRETKIIILNFDFTQNFADIQKSLHVVRDAEFRGDRVLEKPVIDDCPPLSSVALCPGMKFVENDLMLIVRELRDKKRFFRETSSAILKKILCDAARGTISEENSGDTVDRVIAFIRDNFNRQVTNQDIAESVNYHEYHVNKLLQSQTGMSIHRYLLSYRLQMAEKMLITSELSVARISDECGFTSSAYFISAFRKHFGETPNEYRRRRIGMI